MEIIAKRLVAYRKIIKNLGVRGFVGRSLARRAAAGTTSRLVSKHCATPLYVRGATSDIRVFDQIFVDLEYRCLDQLRDVRTIIDAGANVGYSSAYLLTRFPEASIVAIEPDPDNCKVLARNLAPYGSRVALHQAALWSEQGTLDFSANTTGLGNEWARKVEVTNGLGSVKAMTIDQIMAMHGLDFVDILKVDIEGAEEKVFAAQDIGWIKRVKNIVIELHGEKCTNIFMKAVGDRNFAITQCEELTVCLSQD